jgi:hypothetical protein
MARANRNMNDLTIILPPEMSAQRQGLIATWLANPRGIAIADWPDTLSTFDALRRGTVIWQGRSLTFAAFYDTFVEERYATPFIQAVLALANPLAEGYSLLRDYLRAVRMALFDLLGKPLTHPRGVSCWPTACIGGVALAKAICMRPTFLPTCGRAALLSRPMTYAPAKVGVVHTT